MPLDEPPAHRLRTTLGRRRDLVEKAMFGRVGFLLSGNLCCGVWKEWIILRVGPERYQEALAKPFARLRLHRS
ncbi:MAG: hypothetical protein U0794_17650 [Isosphaeraceae bacterium]